MMQDRIEELDWIEARSKCSIGVVFALLKGQVEQDVAKQNDLPEHSKFKANVLPDRIIVISEDESRRSVVFVLSKNVIEVKDESHKVVMTASLTLNDFGECKIKVDDFELELWQFRRRALEGLFFGRS